MQQLPRRESAESTRRAARTFGVVLAIVGLALLALQPSCLYAVVTVSRAARASPHWPTVEGRVVTSKVERFGANKYVPRIVYEYAVRGEPRSSSLIALDRGHASGLAIDVFAGSARQSTTTERDAKALVARFPVDARVPVYYDPLAPRTAVLIPGATGGGVGDFVGCALGLTVSLVLLGVGVRLVRRSRRADADEQALAVNRRGRRRG